MSVCVPVCLRADVCVCVCADCLFQVVPRLKYTAMKSLHRLKTREAREQVRACVCVCA